MDPTTAVVVAVHLQHLTDRTTPAVPREGQIVCVIQGTHPLRRLAEVAVLILSTLEVLTANKKTIDPPSDPADLAA